MSVYILSPEVTRLIWLWMISDQKMIKLTWHIWQAFRVSKIRQNIFVSSVRNIYILFRAFVYLFITHHERKCSIETVTKGGQMSIQLKAAPVDEQDGSKSDRLMKNRTGGLRNCEREPARSLCGANNNSVLYVYTVWRARSCSCATELIKWIQSHL